MDDSPSINVALADDHLLMRAGLTQIIDKEEGLDVKGEAANGKELLELLKTEKIDVVLLDIDMPVMDGKTALEKIVRDFPHVRVIMLTVHQHDSFIVHMMTAGAHGYLLKDSDPTEVISAIKKVKAEGLYFNDRVSKALLGGVASPKNEHVSSIGESLNQREIDVLGLICKEKTTNEIAEALFLSPKTIEGYRKSLLEKTNCKNAAGLAIYAYKNGLHV